MTDVFPFLSQEGLCKEIKTAGADALKTDAPRVSVIIPAFNEEGALPACLDSILGLNEESLEIIVVDNNSSDQTSRVANQKGARVIPCPVQGIAAARNEGAKHARGEFLAFIDADGKASAGWLNAALPVAERSGVVTGWNYFRETNPILGLYFNSYSMVFFTLQMLSSLLGGTVLAGNNMVIRRDLFMAVGGFPRFVGEDVKLARILASQKQTVSFCLGMKVSYSSRRFRKQGFLRTMKVWISSVFSDISEHDYRIDYNVS
jgi:glycosyltransferase involved in cell wall biosynthesis